MGSSATAAAAPSRSSISTSLANSKRSKNQSSIGVQFSRQLHGLMDRLRSTNAHFIKCLRSNAEKRPQLYDRDEMLHQLRYTGVLGLCQLRKLGYAVRFPFEVFVRKYRFLCSPHLSRSSERSGRWPACSRLVDDLIDAGHVTKIVVGKTKVHYHILSCFYFGLDFVLSHATNLTYTHAHKCAHKHFCFTTLDI